MEPGSPWGHCFLCRERLLISSPVDLKAWKNGQSLPSLPLLLLINHCSCFQLQSPQPLWSMPSDVTTCYPTLLSFTDPSPWYLQHLLCCLHLYCQWEWQWQCSEFSLFSWNSSTSSKSFILFNFYNAVRKVQFPPSFYRWANGGAQSNILCLASCTISDGVGAGNACA